ncbi:MAG: hypothetical protein QM762_26330 [Chryseolinea sp.]
MKTIVDRLVNRDRHNKLLIANTAFTVDFAARELREERNSTNRIQFSALKADESGNVPIIFDKLTRNLYDGYVPGGGLPPMTERIVLPAETFVPLAQRRLLHNDHVTDSSPKQNTSSRSHASADKPEQLNRNKRRRTRRF